MLHKQRPSFKGTDDHTYLELIKAAFKPLISEICVCPSEGSILITQCPVYHPLTFKLIFSIFHCSPVVVMTSGCSPDFAFLLFSFCCCSFLYIFWVDSCLYNAVFISLSVGILLHPSPLGTKVRPATADKTAGITRCMFELNSKLMQLQRLSAIYRPNSPLILHTGPSLFKRRKSSLLIDRDEKDYQSACVARLDLGSWKMNVLAEFSPLALQIS